MGLPLWGERAWNGSLYTKDARPGDFLEQYARVFGAVEGNTTFYSSPSPTTVEKWREQTASSFRFCFKLPRRITHELELVHAERDTALFLDLMSPLEERLGPFHIQLPGSFGPDRFDALERFVDWLPTEFGYAVEVRHPAFYREPEARRLDELLGLRKIDRVVMDTRPLRSGDMSHPDVVAASHRKPDLPVRMNRTGRHGFLRLICHPEARTNARWFDALGDDVRDWIDGGAAPYVFIHCANNEKAPPLARDAHERLRAKISALRPMPDWPGEAHETRAGQLSML